MHKYTPTLREFERTLSLKGGWIKKTIGISYFWKVCVTPVTQIKMLELKPSLT
jgi:hypothetical protein